MLNWRKGEILIFSFFILLTLVLTYPVVFRMDSSIFGDPEWTFDSLGSLYGTWWIKYAWLNKFPFTFNHLVAFPFGVDSSQSPSQPLIYYQPLLLSLIGNEFFTYNFFILASFILSAIIGYYLVYYLTKDKLASMISGIIFAFCPNHSLQAFSHMGIAVIQWIPLFILSLLLLCERANYKNAIFCAFSFSLVTLTNYYYGYFVVIFAVGFMLFRVGYGLWGKGRMVWGMKLKTLKVLMLAAAVALVMILPFSYSAIKRTISPVKSTDMFSTVYVRSYGDVFTYAGRLYDYILPSEYHPIFGNLTKAIVERITGGKRHWAERTLYLGYVPLFLAALGIIGWWKRKKDIDLREGFYVPLFMFLLFFMAYCSLAPVVRIWKFKIPTPSLFLYRLVPMFRCYSRMGFLVTLCVAVLAGYGIRNVLRKFVSRWEKGGIVCLFLFLILFEYTIVPPFRNVDLSETPPVYEWLVSEPSDVVIAEYPWVGSIEQKHMDKYLFYQRVHQKKMVNGAPGGSLGEAIGKKARYVEDPETASILSFLGAKYVIVHKDSYSHEDIERIKSNSGLVFIKDFPDAVVFEVVSAKSEVVEIFWKSFAMWEKWDDGCAWRWAGNNAILCLYNTGNENIQVELKFTVLSFHRERTLEIFLNGKMIKKMNVTAPKELSSALRVSLEMELKPGENLLRFFTPEGDEKIDDILHNGDERRVSFAFSNFEVDIE